MTACTYPAIICLYYMHVHWNEPYKLFMLLPQGKRGLPGPRGNSGRAGSDGTNVRINAEYNGGCGNYHWCSRVVENNSNHNELLISESRQGLPGLPGSTGPPVSMVFKAVYGPYLVRKALGELQSPTAAQRPTVVAVLRKLLASDCHLTGLTVRGVRQREPSMFQQTSSRFFSQ